MVYAYADPVNGIAISPTSGFTGPSDVGTVNTGAAIRSPYGLPSVSTPASAPQGITAFGYFVSYETLAVLAIVGLILLFLFTRK